MKRWQMVLIFLLLCVLFLGLLWALRPQAEAPNPLVLSEVLASNDLYPDPDGNFYDFIELHNPSEQALDLSGYRLSDREQEPGWVFPQETTLAPGAYLLLWTHKDAPAELPQLGISAKGETLYLYNSANVLLQTLELPPSDRNYAYARQDDGTYAFTDQATPGFENSPQGYADYLRSMQAEAPALRITEVLTGSRNLPWDGRFCDWIELQNCGDTAVDCGGLYLSDDPEDLRRWQLPDHRLEPGACWVIPCGGDGGAPFGLSKAGELLTLSGSMANVLDQVAVPALEPDTSWALQDGGFAVALTPTPGFENSPDGEAACAASRQPPGPLVIAELMTSNDLVLRQPDGRYYDWVELQNRSDQPLDLEQFSLSKDARDPAPFRLPAGTLAPGQRLVLLCSREPIAGATLPQAPFSLNRTDCRLFVMGPEGLSDSFHAVDIPLGCSMGRPEDSAVPCYFETPTPGAENGAGVLSVCESPRFLTSAGVYENITSLEVTLDSPHTIHYTLDGSTPTARDPVYEGPLTFTGTTVLRAVAMEDGALSSPVVTGAYVLNEGHSLPILSLCGDPGTILGDGGIYRNYQGDREVPCNLSFYDGDDSFSIDCGVKMHGHTGLMNPKKSFKVNFRSQYGPGSLDYPVYGPDAPRHYDSLCIRSGQDYPFSIFRDELFTTLCRQLTTQVPAQRDKFCILYINGQYWGIYCLKEAFSETFYADNYGVPEDSVTMTQAPVSVQTEVFEILQFCRSHDLRDPDNYAWVESVLDLDSVIDWMILEGYSCNGDVQQNLRYFKSTENGNRWQMAFYDLDWSFYFHNPMAHVLDPSQDWQHMSMTRGLMQNPDFRARFLTRLSEALAGPLSDENVLSVIDSYAALLEPEIVRERLRWSGSYDHWVYQVQKLRDFVLNNHQQDIVNNLRVFIGLTDREAETYFGR